MIKKTMKMVAIIFAASILLTSCYTYTSVVGEGAQGSKQITKKNHFVLYGLVDVGHSDSHQMADGATNYTITNTHTFVDGLVGALTFGIYTPTTTIVTK